MVPRTPVQAIAIDQANGNSNWKDSEAKEMKQLAEYKTILDRGNESMAPVGCKRIRLYMIYDIKHDDRHESRLAAVGHLTEPNIDSVVWYHCEEFAWLHYSHSSTNWSYGEQTLVLHI
jgi:hypothetical protein